jgi:hypothetical protein
VRVEAQQKDVAQGDCEEGEQNEDIGRDKPDPAGDWNTPRSASITL